ncbi:Ufm1-specific protease 1 [Bagarius yarrelli]|uniref:Ufm1-specific protease 1 n=2 Tax=Bagarius yarrelli TaxID=175774 RepID=A0A556U6B2_BAGYA|nr:Ufm1-specific protease 1 [Bagarius yarrelli]
MEKNREEVIDWGERLYNRDPLTNVNESVKDVLVKNAHEGLTLPLNSYERCSGISGQCLYYHYGCDGQDDRGWGCGYRTLQTIGSWFNFAPQGGKSRPPPTLREIQQVLVTIGDKPASFLGSKEWIGTYEAALVLDQLYDAPCRLLHTRSGGRELEQAVQDLHLHFLTRGSPVMMGGDRDNSSKGILGVCTGKESSYLLIIDPHFYGPVPDRESLQKNGWVAWRQVQSLDRSSFYNLCLPQT